MKRFIQVSFLILLAFCSVSFGAEPTAVKPKPDARFGNWLYRTPDPATWSRSEKSGSLIFSVAVPAGEFCRLVLFQGGKAAAHFIEQFQTAVQADLQSQGVLGIEADSGPKPSKSQEGFDVLTRNLRCTTARGHSYEIYLAGQSGNRFDLTAFETSSEAAWKQYGAQAGQFLLSLKLANSLPPAEVEKLLGAVPTAPPPTLPGFDDAAPGPAPTPATAPVASEGPVRALPETRVPLVPLEKSPLVINEAVIGRNGKPIEGVKLSQHDMEIGSPSLAVGLDRVIHAAFVEKHRTTYAYAVYYRASADGGKTWSLARNLSEDLPGYFAGRCVVLVDGKQRVYVVWRTGLKDGFPSSVDPWGDSRPNNLVYRVLDGGKWSKNLPVHPPGSAVTQDDGSLSFFAVTDAAGRVQVVWNTTPDKWHPELVHISGTFHQHLSGVGNGLVFQVTLDGTHATTPHEIFLPPVGGLKDSGGYGAYCDGLDTLNGYVDSAGLAHFVAAVTKSHEPIQGKSRFELIEGGKAGPILDLPELSFHAWRDIPTLLVDAAGRRHLLALYNGGEHPNVRDYLVGTDEEPTVIRAAANVKGTVDGFQAVQGPGGRMVAIMQMNDTGERAAGETYVSMSTGQGWSPPVNVTNNAGRRTFASRPTSSESNIAIEKSYYPGPATAAFDQDGHLLLLMINNEYGLFANTAFGVQLAGGSSSTPTLQFLRF